MPDKPAWRAGYDAAERAIAPQLEALVRSPDFARATGAFAGIRRAVTDRMDGLAARAWHLVNLPAGSDVQRLRTQIGALDREVRRLTLALEQQRAQQRDGE